MTAKRTIGMRPPAIDWDAEALEIERFVRRDITTKLTVLIVLVVVQWALIVAMLVGAA